MNNDTDAAAGRLLHHLQAGRRPDAAPLEEVAEMLAGGVPDEKRTKAVVEVMHRLDKEKLLKLDDTGKKTYSLNLHHIGIFSGSRSVGNWPTTEHPVYSLQHSELRRAKPLLQAEGLWPALADQWCGVEAAAAAAVKAIAFSAKAIVIGQIKPHCSNIQSLLHNASLPENAWLKAFQKPGGKGWDLDGLVAELKARNLWVEARMPTQIISMGKLAASRS